LEHLCTNVFESGGVLNGLIDGHVANNARDRHDQRIRICTGVDEKAIAQTASGRTEEMERGWPTVSRDAS
jgi:hypothetical protein